MALKVLKKQAMENSRIAAGVQREYAVGKKLRHPNLVEIYEAGQHEGWTYLVMEYVAGRDLAGYLSSAGTLSLPEVESLCRQMFGGLSAIHGLGVVHCDIKPNNVMLRADGAWKLMDFGTSRLMKLPKTVGPAIGTPEYMSPEQFMDLPTTQTSDIYSVGVLLYEAMTGVQPLRKWSLLERCTAIPPPFAAQRPDVPAWLVALVMRCLQPKPEDRYANADAVLASLSSFEPIAQYVKPDPAPTAAPDFHPVAELLTEESGNVNLLTSLLETMLQALKETD